MSYSDSFPTQRPSLNLVFNGGSDQLDSRISFSRSDTPPTYAAPSAVHYWSNEKHLSSLNLTSNSEDFSAWAKTNATATANTTTAPDGNTTASTLTGNTGTAVKYAQSNKIAVDDPVISVYAKAGTHSYIQITDNAASNEFANFDLTNGTVGTVGAGATAAIQAVGSTGWYRCLMRITQTSTAFEWRVVMIDSSTAARQSTTSSTGTVNLWGAMMTELGDLTNVVAYQSSGSQIHREYSSTLKSVSNAGDPRFEYDPTDGQSEGLLIEASATNLQRYGSAFASWSSTKDVVITSNAAIAPDGTLAATHVVANSTLSDHYVFDNGATLVSGTDYTASVYVKDAGQRYVQLVGSSSNFGTSKWATFDLVDGSIDATNVTASAESVGNGWWRIQATMTATGSTQGNIFVALADSATAARSPSFTGDDYSGVLLFGYQLEAAASASSLVNSGSQNSALTRASDSCSVAVSDFAGFADTEGAVVVEATVNSLDSGNAAAVSLANAAGTEYIKTGYEIGGATDQSVRTYVRSNSLDQAWLDAGSVSTTGSYKVGVRYEKNNVGISLNGASAVTDTVATMPIGMTTLYIGSGNSSGGNPLNANLKRIAYYSEPLSDANLTALTS